VPRLLRFGCAALVAALLPAMVCAQTTAPSAPPRPISDAQVAKLFSDLATNGVNGPIPSGITTALGLTRAGETLNVRQDTVIDSADASKAAHTFLKLGNGNVVVAKVNEDGSVVRVYYADPRFVLISALIARKPPGGTFGSDITVVPVAAAKDDWNAELGSLATISAKL
jgi:hypothetical protein